MTLPIPGSPLSVVLLTCFSMLQLGCGIPDDPSELEPTPVPPAEAGGRLFYAVTKVEGTYGGGARKVINGGVDTLADVRCRFASMGTNANQKPFLGDPATDTWSKGITVAGQADCPAGLGSSTGTAGTCQAAAHVQASQFQWSVELKGWSDDAEVVLKATAPAVLPFSCNFASVLGEQGHPWGLVARTTVGQFRAGVPFEVRFVGSNTLTHDGNVSEVGWDLRITIAPR